MNTDTNNKHKDSVEVVRCKNCRFFNDSDNTFGDDKDCGTCKLIGGLWYYWDFCSQGLAKSSSN